MELESILGGLILLFVIYYGTVKIGAVITFIGVSIFVGLVLYTEGYYDLMSILKAFGVILLIYLVIYIAERMNLKININIVIKLVFGFIFCFWMYDTFSWWGLFTAILIAIILLMHREIIPGIILSVGVVMIFLLAQRMGVIGIIAGVIACLFSVMPLYNEPWAKNL